jgi:predicted transcriptional regulator
VKAIINLILINKKFNKYGTMIFLHNGTIIGIIKKKDLFKKNIKISLKPLENYFV